MNIKTVLFDLLQRAHAEEQSYLDSLTAAERAAAGTLEDWSPKDLIGHLAAWKTWTIAGFEAAERGETPASAGDLDERNAIIYDTYREKSWDDILPELEQGYAGLVALVEQLTPADLFDPHRYAWLKGFPAWKRIVGTGFRHPYIHLAENHAKQGRIDTASAMLERMFADLVAVDPTPDWQADAWYRLARFYAGTDQTTLAMTRLQAAITLHPALKADAQQDRALAALHADPAYQSLVS